VKLNLHTVTPKEVAKGKFGSSCQAGAVHGFARVIASGSFSSSFTSAPGAVDPGLRFNCAGGTVRARRVSKGVYHVNFAPNVGALAFGNGEGNTLVSTRVVNDPTIGDKPVFRVEVRDPTGFGGAQPADVPFSILVP
jgi:hypothetical protein